LLYNNNMDKNKNIQKNRISVRLAKKVNLASFFALAFFICS
jgi:hypothetical protein